MNLNEAKQILNENGYLLEDKYMDDITKPITVDYIDQNNYEDYIGQFVNVTGSVHLNSIDLTKLPIKFGTVGGDFWCFENKLTSLKGAPNEVGRDFYCSYNNLTSLEDAPEIVGRVFDCSHNKIKFTKDDVLSVSDVEGGIVV